MKQDEVEIQPPQNGCIFLWKDDELDKTISKEQRDNSKSSTLINKGDEKQRSPKKKISQDKTKKEICISKTFISKSYISPKNDVFKTGLTLTFEHIKEMTLDDILKFVFPEGQSRPRTACRLWCLAEHITQFARVSDNSVRMLSGCSNRWYLKPKHDLKVVLDLIEQAFYKDVYYKGKIAIIDEKQHLEHQIYANASVKMCFLHYSREEIRELLNRHKRRDMEPNNHFIQRIILEDRTQRVTECMKAIPDKRKCRI